MANESDPSPAPEKAPSAAPEEGRPVAPGWQRTVVACLTLVALVSLGVADPTVYGAAVSHALSVAVGALGVQALAERDRK